MEGSPARPSDRAIDAWAAGDRAEALRWAVPLLEAQPDSALALLVTAYLGAKEGDAKTFAVGFETALTRAVDAGQLPLAVAAGALARELGLDAAPLLDAVATAFARGSPRIKHRAPPALPAPEPAVRPLPDTLLEKPLLDRAWLAVEAAVALSPEKGDAKPALPAAPLFSSLDRGSLRAFVEIFETRLFPANAVVVEEGALGAEAFVVARGELEVKKRAAGGAAVQLARLGNGALVGEMALLSRAPRAATVSTASPTLLLVADKQALDAAVEKSPELGSEFAEHCRRRMLDTLVKTSPILRNVNPAERAELVRRFSIRTFEPGERLITQGQASEGLYVIASGEVAIVLCEDTEQTVVARLGSGEVLGEVALVLRRPAIADAVANHPTVTLFLARDRFLEAARAHPMVFVDLYELAVRRDEETHAAAELEATNLDESILV